ncbi:MAG TPA: four helix bundle protein [Vicinamibacterales bacterium]|nr:four helix bundle protein [Vicinamibacterales bacterium]
MNARTDLLKERTMQFALRVARFCKTLPATWECGHVADQLFRSSTGQASNYFSSCRGRTHREFRAKLGIALEESDETLFWLTFISRSGMSTDKELDYLLGESRELIAIFTASLRTAIANSRR